MPLSDTSALFAAVPSNAGVYLSVSIAPPPLPAYEQPLIPGPGYLWTPGYWAWEPQGFYWVPGTWVLAPFTGALWTPGYWGWDEGSYFWRPGYWGRHVGFYGGIDYGFGYTGVGYLGGYWDRGVFAYNRACNNVNVTYVRNVYTAPVAPSSFATRVSYNGGLYGVVARPTAQDRFAAREPHAPMVPVQARHELAAGSNRAQFASVNNGRPALAATPRPQVAVPSHDHGFPPQAVGQPRAAPPRADIVASSPRLGDEVHSERRYGPPNGNAAHFQAALPVQREMRQQSFVTPREPMRTQAQLPSQPRMQPSARMPEQAAMHQQAPMRSPAQSWPQPARPQSGPRPDAQPQSQGDVARQRPDRRQQS